MGNWPVALLIAAMVMLFRWQGDSWPVTMTKVVGLMVLVLATVAILGSVIVRLS